MKSFKQLMTEGADKESENDGPEYKAFFNKMLKKYKVKDPSELSKEDQKKFYDEVDAGWKGDNEND
jgi:hypothetical protein